MSRFNRMFLTGFGPFGSIRDNPSAVLARSCGAPYEILPVAFSSVEAFLDARDFSRIDALLMIGVAAGRNCLSLETTARNVCGDVADVEGIRRGPGPIEPGGPDSMIGTLWEPALLDQVSGDVETSDDAGKYLCNFIYYRALQKLPRLRIGFLHVPTFEFVSQSRQQVLLRTLLNSVASPE